MTIATLYTIREVLAAALHSLKTGEDSSAAILNKFERVMIAVQAAIAQLEKENTPITKDLLIAIGGIGKPHGGIQFDSPTADTIFDVTITPEGSAEWGYLTSDMAEPATIPAAIAPQTMSAAVALLLSEGVLLTVSTPPAEAERVPLAQPLKLRNGQYVNASIKTATHLKIRFPGPSGTMYLPVCLNSKVDLSWLWNGDIYAPTLTPSVHSRLGPVDNETICHSWVREGRVEFLGDSTHEYAGQTLDLLPVNPTPPEPIDDENRPSRTLIP